MVSLPPPPGWYPDPSGRARTERWWDGQRWSDDLRAAGSIATDPSPGGSADGGPDRAARAPIPLRAVLWAVLGILAGEVVGGVLAGAVTAATGAKVTSALPELAGELGLWAGMLGSCLLVSHRFGTGSLQRDLGLRLRGRDVGWGALAAVAALVVVAVVSAAFSGTPLAGTNTGILSGQKGNEAGYVVVTLIAALGAPVFEELFFRGLLRTALTGRLGVHGAIVGQAVLFGLAHLGEAHGLGNVSVVVALACVGVVLGYTAHLTGRLGAGMIAHSLFNLTAALTVLLG